MWLILFCDPVLQFSGIHQKANPGQNFEPVAINLVKCPTSDENRKPGKLGVYFGGGADGAIQVWIGSGRQRQGVGTLFCDK